MKPYTIYHDFFMKKQDTWNLALLYSGETDPKIDADTKTAEEKIMIFVKKWKGRKDYMKKPDVLAEALREYEDLNARYGLAGNADYYWWLRSKLDQDDTKIKAKINKLHEQSVKLANEMEFFTLRIGKIEKDLQQTFLNYPKLKPYRHFLEKLFEAAKYQLSEDQEKILNITGKTSHSNWVDMVKRFLSREERIVLDEEGKKSRKNFSEIQDLLKSGKKRVRKSAAKAFENINTQHSDVAEVELNSIYESKKFEDDLRGFDRPDAARHLSSDIDTEVVDAMISAVHSHFDLSARYYALKAKLLKLPKLSYYERVVPYGSVDKKYPFNEGVRIVEEVFKGLDPEFAEILGGFVSEGRFDVYPKKAKSSGAFCVDYLKVSPTYILLNYSNKVDDVLTMAHELGHGINSELMKMKQNSLNFGSPLSIAEVASTFFEDFVLEKLLKDADDDEKLTLMVEKMDDTMSSIYRQVAAYRFEQELHENIRNEGYLSKEAIGEIFIKHMKSYMGDAVMMDHGAEYGWVYWGHFRRFFYVYSYASGLLISKGLQKMVREEPGSITKVKEIISAGSSKAPTELFNSVGIDITDTGFWEEGLSETERLLEETEKLAKKQGKI
jgi:oligoendopeptidase F